MSLTVAILGHGTVGRSVYELLEKHGDITVKYVLELPQNCSKPYMVSDKDIIMNDKEVELVVDALPAVHPSYEFIKDALTAGKHVVTSNKAALCFGFEELMDLARENGVELRYEASCGGTIPDIAEAISLSGSNDVTACYGIMNGTTNFILDKMATENSDFDETLKEAQKLGFAEADPTADIGGYDVKNKIVILSNTAYRGYTTADIPVSGIEKITKKEIADYAAKGQAIKLLGISVREGNRYALGVVPCILGMRTLEANVPKNFNMFTLKCSNAGDVKLYGQGAGGYPTADAVVRDILMVKDGVRMGGSDYFGNELVYDPELLTGTGYIGDEEVSGNLKNLTEKAKEADKFFAFLPDFMK
ncbi:MAG: homoserine dehydrogenase [Eubacteriales bacterium]|nr:homoserine dehydrogenase [Eubacteriales bacterium]